MSLQAYIESLSPAAYYPFNSDTPLSPIGTTVIPRIWNKTIVGSGDGPKVLGAGDRYLGFRSSDLTYLSYPTMFSFVNGATTNTVIAVIRRVTGNDAGATANNMLTPTDAECSVVCLDDADGTIHNDLILRVTP